MFLISNGAIVGIIVGSVVLLNIIVFTIVAIALPKKISKMQQNANSSLHNLNTLLSKYYETLYALCKKVDYEKNFNIETINLLGTSEDNAHIKNELDGFYDIICEVCCEKSDDILGITDEVEDCLSLKEELERKINAYNAKVIEFNNLVSTFPLSMFVGKDVKLMHKFIITD